MRRKYYVNDEAFSGKIDEEKSYWLGFLAADGCVTKDNRVNLKLKKGDINHIEKFKRFLQYDGVIEIRKCELGKSIRDKGLKEYYETALIRVSSKKICQDLKRYGICSNKSLILEFPNNIPDNMLRHYIRGYIDGDGCWSSDKNKYKSIRLTILSTKNFLSKINEIFIKQKIVKNYNKIRKPSKIYSLSFGGNKQSKKIAEWLYFKSSIYLNRKKQFLQNNKIIDKDGKQIEKIIDVKGCKNSNAKKYELTSPNKKKYIVHGNLRNFCKKHKLRYSNILDVRFKRKANYKGWLCNLITQ